MYMNIELYEAPKGSSIIYKMGYDPEEKVAAVVFTNNPNKAFFYQNVTQEQWEQWIRAESVGSWFVKNIKIKPESHPYDTISL